jgi:GntR family transcriptional regulator/MocR family aminotransferase
MPKQIPDLPLPGIRLDPGGALSLHRQLYEQLSSAIRSGQLKPGTRLPSTRAFALTLGVSRTTTLEAYRDLQIEGYLESRVGAGTLVAQTLPDLLPSTKTGASASGGSGGDNGQNPGEDNLPRLSQRGMQFAAQSSPVWFARVGGLRPFRLGAPALDAFPQKAWARAVNRAVRYSSGPQLDYQEAAGYRPLREEIAAYLAVARGVRCTADQVMIVAGIQSGLTLIANLLLDARDAIWVEDPGYLLARMALQAAGATLVPIPIDREGLIVAEGKARGPEARLAYVTPTHQFPLGVTMSYARRRELLQWAQQAGAWIIEDDYDSEYQYAGRPIPALQGLDDTGQVIYMGTFSKVLFPALRLGYVVVPPPLVDAFITAQRVMSFHPPVHEQLALTSFMAEGEFIRHIRRMRGLYEERRDCLLAYARQVLPENLQFAPRQSGLHVIGRLPEDTDEFELVRSANQQEITVYPLSGFWIDPTVRRGLVLGFAAFREEEIKVGLQKLAVAWRKLSGL